MSICTVELLYALVICLGSLTAGNICGYPSPTGEEIRAHHNLSETSVIWSFYNAITHLFAILGPLYNEIFLKIFKNSRKKTMFMISIVCGLLWFGILATEASIWGGLVFRALLGIFVGSYSSLTPIYLIEMAPIGHSGFYGSLHPFMTDIAYALVSFLGPSLGYLNLVYFCACFPLLQAVLIWFIPDTAETGQSLVSQIKVNKTESFSLTIDSNAPKLCQKKYIPGILIGFSLMFFMQFSGELAIATNLSDIFEGSGLAELHPSYQAGIAQLAKSVGCIVICFFIDKIGRKLAYIISCGGSFFFLLLYSLNLKFGWSHAIPIVSIFLYNAIFAIGMGTIPWFIVPEFFPYKLRSKASGSCVVFTWICSFAIILIFPLMVDGMGMFGTFIFFTVVCFVALLFGIFILKDVTPMISAAPSVLGETLQLTIDNPIDTTKSLIL